MQETPEKDAPSGLRDRVLDTAIDPLYNLFLWRAGAIGFWGVVGLIALLFVSAYQVTPGREFFELGWPVAVYFAIAGVAGGLLGLVNGQRRFLGLVAGAAAAAGSLGCVVLLFEFVPHIPIRRVWGWVNMLALVVGLFPGVALYAILDRRISRNSLAEEKANARLQRRRQQHGLSAGGPIDDTGK